jgi:hypothetical protein
MELNRRLDQSSLVARQACSQLSAQRLSVGNRELFEMGGIMILVEGIRIPAPKHAACDLHGHIVVLDNVLCPVDERMCVGDSGSNSANTACSSSAHWPFLSMTCRVRDQDIDDVRHRLYARECISASLSLSAWSLILAVIVNSGMMFSSCW